MNNYALSKIWILIILIIFTAGGILVWQIFGSGFNNRLPNVATDNEDNLHIVWSRSKSYYEQELYYKKLDSEGRTLINTTNLGSIKRLLHGPEIVVDSKNNVHIFVGIEKEDVIIQHLIVRNGVISFEREIKKGDETREPAVGIDNDDNIYLIYSVWNATRDNRGIITDWDIRYYLEKLNRKGEILTGPVEIRRLTFPEASGAKMLPTSINKIIFSNDKLYFAIRLSTEQGPKFKYAEMDKNGKILRFLDSSIEYYANRYPAGKTIGKDLLAVLATGSSRLCFNDSCIVDSNNNVYYFYSFKEKGKHRCYLRYKKFDQMGKVIKEGKITEFAKDPLYWIFDPVILDIQSCIDKNDNLNITYYTNDGFNNFSIFYSRMDKEGKILIERLKVH